MKEKVFSLLKNAVKEQKETRQVFRENEIEANHLLEKILVLCICFMGLLWVLNTAGILAIGDEYVRQVFVVSIVSFAVPVVISVIFNGEKSWLKYMLIMSVIISTSYLDGVLTFNVTLLIILPVVLSCRYYSSLFTIWTAIITTVFFTFSAYFGAVSSFGNPDLNFADPDKAVYIRNVMLLSFLPRWIVFILFSTISTEIARCGRKMVLRQDKVSKQTARVETELEMASRIQEQALPSVKNLPDNRYRHFDLAAKMTPAKEVGGDFYDFFYPDPEHLALIIADVADKGIAASLYMMMSKALIDSRLSLILSPGKVLENVNRQLHIKSPGGMFVTAWVGVLDLKTGEMVTANAGHEYPCIKRKDSRFEEIKDKHGFVLGGFPEMRYPETRIKLEEGDVFFVYTDGATETNDINGKMFGTGRMLDSLDRHSNGDMESMITDLKTDIDKFSTGMQPFDDITMLALRFGQAYDNNGICLKPVMEELQTVQSYIDDIVGKDRISEEQSHKISIAVDEVFSNIVNYSGASNVHVVCETGDGKIGITFTDDGKQFDPLAAKFDNIADKRDGIGGFGIFITCKTMDSVEYHYEDGKNILKIESNVEKEMLIG